MTEGDHTTAGRSRGLIGLARFNSQVALAVLTGLLVLAFVVVLGLRIVHPESLSPGRAAASADQARDEHILAAARRAGLAFLDVDYRDLKPRMDKVISLSTGTFKKEYQSSAVEFAAAAKQGHAVSHGDIVRIGIEKADDDAAIVYVAADQTVSNLAIDAARKKDPKVDGKRLYRFQLNMTRVGDRWFLSGLKAVL